MPFMHGYELKTLREKLGVSQSSLTAYIRVSVAQISRYEREGTDNNLYISELLRLIEKRNGEIVAKTSRWSKPR